LVLKLYPVDGGIRGPERSETWGVWGVTPQESTFFLSLGAKRVSDSNRKNSLKRICL
jgi:hypothetical protein